jgi:hypothetical protein
MLDLYVVGFATNLGSEQAVVVDVGGHPYRLHHAGDRIGPTPRFREPKIVKPRPVVVREPQKPLGHGVLLGADDRALGLVEYVGQEVTAQAVTTERAQGLRPPGQETFSEGGCAAVFVLISLTSARLSGT